MTVDGQRFQVRSISGGQSLGRKRLALLLASCAGWILAGNTAAFAACSDSSPSTGDAVTCDSSAPNPDRAGVVGVAGVNDVDVTVNADSAVTNPGTFETVAIHSRGTGWTVDNSGTISNTDGLAAVGLGYGGTVTNRAGGVISSSAVSSEGLAFSTGAVIIEGGPASVVNDGRIESNSQAIYLRSGGSIVNRGTLAGGVDFYANGTIDNLAGALIEGSVSAADVLITNAGRIDGSAENSTAVTTRGAFINQTGGEVIGQYIGVSLNSSPIFTGLEVPDGGGRQDGPVVVAQRMVINESGASITALVDGLEVAGAHVIVENSGTITGTRFNGVRVENSNGTTVRNRAGGVIFGRDIGVRYAALFPSFQSRGSGSLTNDAGATITGVDTAAVEFGNDFDDVFTNAGIVNGNVLMGEGDDTLNHDATTGTLSASIDGGAGTGDVFNLTDGAFDITRPVNFETVGISSGGRGFGTGTVGGISVASGGTLAPGRSIGTLSVTGGVTFAEGSTFEVEIAADGTSDRVEATGRAALDGTLSVLGIDYPTGYPDAESYTILTADGGVSGTFATVMDNLPDVDVVAAYRANSVDISYDKAGTPGPGPGPTPEPTTFSDKSIYPNTLTGIGDAGRLFTDTLRSRSSLEGGTGGRFAGTSALAYLDDTSVKHVAGGNSAAEFVVGGYSPLEPYGVWMAGLGQQESYDAWGGFRGFDAGTLGLAVGAERAVLLSGGTALFGVSFGYTNSDVDSGAGSASADAYHLGVYGSYENGPLELAGALSHAWTSTDFTRSVALVGGGTAVATGETDGQLWSGSLGASYDIAKAAGWRQDIGLKVAPTFGLDLVHVGQDGFTETGAGILNLTVADEDASQVWTSIGVTVGTRHEMSGGAVVSPQVSIGWEHAFAEQPVVVSSIPLAGATFSTAGVAEDQDLLELGAGLGFEIAGGTTGHVRYEGAFGDQSQRHTAWADLTYRF